MITKLISIKGKTRTLRIPERALDSDFKEGFANGYLRASSVGYDRAKEEVLEKLGKIYHKSYENVPLLVYWLAELQGIDQFALDLEDDDITENL